MASVKNKLQEIFREVFDDDTISLSPDLNADDIENWDSLNHVKMLLACEEEFEVKFDVQEVDDLTFAKDLISLIEKKILQ